MDIFDKTPFFEMYKLNPEDYSDIDISELSLSLRSFNCLKRININTVDELLKLSPDLLNKVRNMGQKSIKEIVIKIESLEEKDFNRDIRQVMANYKENIIKNDFSFIKDNDNKKSKKYIEARDVLGEELTKDSINGSSSLVGLYIAFDEFVKESKQKERRYEEYLSSIPLKRKNNTIDRYIMNYSKNEEDALFFEQYGKGVSVDEYTRKIVDEITDIPYKLACFLRNLNSNVSLKDVYETIRDSRKEVVFHRARNKTLQEIGSTFGITRERIRQLEADAIKGFRRKNGIDGITKINLADIKDSEIITKSDFTEYFGDVGLELFFLIAKNDIDRVSYYKELDLLYVGDFEKVEEANDYFEKLPGELTEEECKNHLGLAVEKIGLSKEFSTLIFEKQYNRTGRIWHKKGVTKLQMIKRVLREHYPDGMLVYDKKELAKFRNYMKNTYGEDRIPQSDRALSSRIADAGILCGKGKYKLLDENCISKELEKKIIDYIDACENDYILFQSIFWKFQSELLNEGITNKYYLHGVLRESLNDKYAITKNAICKDNKTVGVYDRIVDYIKSFDYPITVEDIKKAFHGIEDFTIVMATNDSDIINLFGKYIHKSKVKVTDEDYDYLETTLNDLLTDVETIHIRVVFKRINRDYPELLYVNNISNVKALYSFLKCILSDKFQFINPYIGLMDSDMDVETPINMVRNLIYENGKLDIEQIKKYAEENHYRIISVRSLILNKCDEVCFINDSEVATEEYIGINDSIVKNVEKNIINELSKNNEAKLVSNLECINSFPSINVEWNEWIIYSIILKYSEKLFVDSFNSRIKNSKAVIGLTDEDVETLIEMGDGDGGHHINVKIDSIDDVLDELIDEEW